MKSPLIAIVIFSTAVLAFADSSQTTVSSYASAGVAFPIGTVTYIGLDYLTYSMPVHAGTFATTVGFFSIKSGIALQLAQAAWRDRWSYATLGVAFLGSAAFEFADSGEDRFRDRMAFQISPGFSVNYFLFSGDPSYYSTRDPVQPGFAGLASIRYRLDQVVSLSIDFSYWGRYIGPNVGFGFAFGLN